MLFLDTNAILYYLHDVKPYSQIVEDITSEEDELYTSILLYWVVLISRIKYNIRLEGGLVASIDALKRELEAYEKMRKELLEKYRGKVVAIKDGKLVGVYDSEEEAFRDVVEKYGLVPVLIKRVTEKEKPEEIPSYTYGLLGVVLTD